MKTSLRTRRDGSYGPAMPAFDVLSAVTAAGQDGGRLWLHEPDNGWSRPCSLPP